MAGPNFQVASYNWVYYDQKIIVNQIKLWRKFENLLKFEKNLIKKIKKI